jgi:hypothetical protein
MFLKPLCLGAGLLCGVLAVVGLHQPPHDGCPGMRLLSLAFTTTVADTKVADKPALSGTWNKKDGEVQIEFADNVMKIALHGGPAMIAVVCDCKVEKGGLVKAKVTGFEGKEEIKKAIQKKLPAGLTFNFKWTAKGGTAKLADLKGDKVPEKLKTHLEGDYKKK